MKNSVPWMETTILIIFQLSLISEHEKIITYINDLQDVLLTVLVRAQDCTQTFAGRGKEIPRLCLETCIEIYLCSTVRVIHKNSLLVYCKNVTYSACYFVKY